jgi:hypothetical protein
MGFRSVKMNAQMQILGEKQAFPIASGIRFHHSLKILDVVKSLFTVVQIQ